MAIPRFHGSRGRDGSDDGDGIVVMSYGCRSQLAWQPAPAKLLGQDGPVRYELDPAHTALLVIDAQEEYFDPDGPAYFPEAAATLGALNRLIEAFDGRAAPVIYLRHAHRDTGVDVGRMGDFAEDDEEDSFVEGSARVAFHSGLREAANATIVTKNRYDSFIGTDLEGILRTLGIRTVVVSGYMTSFCCDSTARGAHSRDYETVFVLDAVGGPDLERLDGSDYPAGEVKEDVAAALAAGFADVVSVDDVVAALGG